jgi:hypothetical protein
MVDRPSEAEVDARLRAYLGAEQRQAELDFPGLARPAPPAGPTRVGNRDGHPVGVLAAVVAVLVFAVLGSRFLGGSSVGITGAPTLTAGANASVPASAPSASLSASPPSASLAPPTQSNAPSARPSLGIVECGQISAAACAKAVALARAGHEAEVAGATRIVVDDTCPPTVVCDRIYPFDSIVVFVTAGADTTGWYAFSVVGKKADTPTDATPWGLPELPAHVVQTLKGPQPTP